MTRRISKHGTVYTEGSSSTSPDCYPRVCSRCGGRILVSRQDFENRCDHTPAGQVFSSRHLDARDCSEATAGAVVRSAGRQP